jgi:FxsC-like protein
VRASAAITAPYFFLSYAHESSGDADDELDYWVGEFYRDLCRSVERQTDLPKGMTPGFMDRRRRLGDEWPSELVRALATCRAFVPLYSSRYFADEHCGKEWKYFADRTSDPVALETAIVPGIWDPVETARLPAAACTPHFSYLGSAAYETFGLYGIMKLSRYRKEYSQIVGDLAGQLVKAAESCPVKKGPRVDYGALESAFGRGEATPGGSADKPLRITVVAPCRGGLPEGREDSSFYGLSTLDWKPYFPDSTRPIAERAAGLARSLGFRVETGDLGQHERDLRAGDPRSGPQILIIDPWALLMPRNQELLQWLDRRPMPWVQAIVPWNAADEENRKLEGKLRAELDAAFGHKLAEVASTSEAAARGVPRAGDFDLVLRQLVGTAAKRFLSHAEAFPPGGDVVERPQIS